MHWNHKFLSGEITFDEMQRYDNKLLELGEMFCASNSSILMQFDDVASYVQAFLKNHRELNALLVCHIPGQPDAKWCSLPVLLEEYGLCLPLEALELIAKVTFPSQTPADIPCEMSVDLHNSTTLKELDDLVQAVHSFLKPIAPHVSMLIFFKLVRSALYDKYRRYHLKKFAVPQDARSRTEPMSLTSIKPPSMGDFFPLLTSAPPPASSYQPSSSKDLAQGLSVDSIVDSLRSTHNLIRRIMKGTATYLEIVAEDEELLKRLDLEKEFGILSDYAKVEKLPCSDYEGLHGVQSMLEIPQCATLVKNIFLVCNQYGLEACKTDCCLREVMELTQDYAEEKHKFSITPLVAIDKMKRVRKILCLKEKTSLKCLDIFEAVLNSAAFYQFLKDKHFYGTRGQDTFRKQYQLITAQLQHEEYDEKILNHLLPAFKVIFPFLSVSKCFKDLMTEVASLNAEYGLEQLRTVNANIMQIRRWFYRSEVRKK